MRSIEKTIYLLCLLWISLGRACPTQGTATVGNNTYYKIVKPLPLHPELIIPLLLLASIGSGMITLKLFGISMEIGHILSSEYRLTYTAFFAFTLLNTLITGGAIYHLDKIRPTLWFLSMLKFIALYLIIATLPTLSYLFITSTDWPNWRKVAREMILWGSCWGAIQGFIPYCIYIRLVSR